MYCSQCGYALAAFDTKCPRCGAPASAATTNPPPPNPQSASPFQEPSAPPPAAPNGQPPAPPYGGPPPTPPPYGPGGGYQQPSAPGDAPDTLWALIGFFVPIAGLIMYLVNQATAPLKARSALRGAGLGFGLGLASIVLLCSLGLIGGAMGGAARRSTVTPGPTTTVASMSDAQFAQTTFEALASGDQSVASSIDWENFSSMGTDAGAMYRQSTSDAAHQAFQQSFISSFSRSYKGAGATPTAFSNWRQTSSDANSSVITADGAKGSINVTVSKRDGVYKMAGIGIAK